jgi:nitrogen regulatory protein PII/ribosomal protein S18 acetylase RimI-like enzyme
MYNAIFVIVDKGNAETVIDTAVKAGSMGGTIINARGSGIHETSKLFSMEIEPEKEMVLILSENQLTEQITSSMKEQLQIDKPGNSIIFVQDLNKTYVPILPDNFQFVDGNDIKDQKSRLLCCHLGFHPDDEPDRLPVKDFYMEHAPSFRPELQIMTQDDNGNLCSYCVIWYDEKLKIGLFEPVCTRIDYRMRGIGKAMLTEGLRRLKEIGAEKAYVGCSDSLRTFYNSAGFTTYGSNHAWKKKF